jgi:hypothetical protein
MPPHDQPLSCNAGHHSAKIIYSHKCEHMTRATNHILPMYLMFFESNMRPADAELDGAVVSATHTPALHFLPMMTRLLSA